MTADVEEYLPDYKFEFEDTSSEGAGVFYRSDRTRELQDKFGDMLHSIHDLEVHALSPLKYD